MRRRLRLLPLMIFAATCLLSIKIVDLADGIFVHVPSVGIGRTMAAADGEDPPADNASVTDPAVTGEHAAEGGTNADAVTGAGTDAVADMPVDATESSDSTASMSAGPGEPPHDMGDGADMDDSDAGPVGPHDSGSAGEDGGQADQPWVLALGDDLPYTTPPLPLGDSASMFRDPTAPVYTAEELAVLQALSQRRDVLDARSDALDARERQLAVAEQRIDEKIIELGALQARIEESLAAYDTQEDDSILSLVKIYEAMKPKDAAPIFDQLDMAILLEIVSRMSSIRSAPILARMDPTRAQEVTEELAHLLQQRPDFMAESQVEPAE